MAIIPTSSWSPWTNWNRIDLLNGVYAGKDGVCDLHANDGQDVQGELWVQRGSHDVYWMRRRMALEDASTRWDAYDDLPDVPPTWTWTNGGVAPTRIGSNESTRSSRSGGSAYHEPVCFDLRRWNRKYVAPHLGVHGKGWPCTNCRSCPCCSCTHNSCTHNNCTHKRTHKRTNSSSNRALCKWSWLPKPIGIDDTYQDTHEMPHMQCRSVLPKLQDLPHLLRLENKTKTNTKTKKTKKKNKKNTKNLFLGELCTTPCTIGFP